MGTRRIGEFGSKIMKQIMLHTWVTIDVFSPKDNNVKYSKLTFSGTEFI